MKFTFGKDHSIFLKYITLRKAVDLQRVTMTIVLLKYLNNNLFLYAFLCNWEKKKQRGEKDHSGLNMENEEEERLTTETGWEILLVNLDKR